jgi:PadR family transcriptional regulator PadR
MAGAPARAVRLGRVVRHHCKQGPLIGLLVAPHQRGHIFPATATPLVLAILAKGNSYGYAILKRVSELSGGELQWTDGMLYPVLHRLERQGHIKGKWGTSETGRKRKYYHLTARGQAQLAGQCQQWQMVDATLRNIWPAVSLQCFTRQNLAFE